jgi:thiamine biosynthesis lipoprotein
MAEPSASVTFPALGTTAVVAVADRTRLGRARDAVEQVVDAFDLACSRFRDDSEVRSLRADAGRAAHVSPLLFDAIAASLRAAQLTDGDVDPTVGRALVALGYDRDFAAVGAGGSVARQIKVVQVPGWRTVALDPEAGTVTVPAGVELDLGATAKALAADRAAAAVASQTGCGALVSLGGDLAVAGPAPDEGWRVRVTDDHRDGVDAPGQWIAVRSGGLATSSTTARRWDTGSGQMHHVVDPASGYPADGCWRTVSVAAASCLDANIASTAAIVRGERAVGWLQSLGLPSRLVRVDGTVRYLAGWPSRGDDLRAEGDA